MRPILFTTNSRFKKTGQEEKEASYLGLMTLLYERNDDLSVGPALVPKLFRTPTEKMAVTIDDTSSHTTDIYPCTSCMIMKKKPSLSGFHECMQLISINMIFSAFFGYLF